MQCQYEIQAFMMECVIQLVQRGMKTQEAWNTRPN